MLDTALKQKAIQYIEELDEEQTMRVITYIEAFPKKKPLQNSKTPEERRIAIEAFNDLERMSRPAGEISNNGRDEWIDAFWRKYESLS